MTILRPVSELEMFDSGVSKAMQYTRVAYPGIIRSFDPETVTCVVDVGVMSATGVVPEGSTSIDRLDYTDQQFPLLLDAPVFFPRGGGYTLTFPLKPGDECFVIISSRELDFWWQSGGVQKTDSGRNHAFSDAFVMPGPQSQVKKISGISTSAVELRSDDNKTKLSLDSATGSINGIAPGGFNLNGLKILPDGRLQLVGGAIVDGHIHGGVERGGSDTDPLN